MKGIIIVGLVAYLGLANASGIFDKIDDAFVNKAADFAKHYIAKFDPVDKVDVTDYIISVLQYNASKIYVSGFSDFELTDVDVKLNSLALNIRFKSIVASVDNWHAHTIVHNSIGLESLNAILNGLQVDFAISWTSDPATVTSVNLLPHVDSGSVVLQGDLNGREANINFDKDGLQKVNQLFVDNSKELNESVRTAINWVLKKAQS